MQDRAHPDAPWRQDRPEDVWSVNARVLCAAKDTTLGPADRAAAGD